MNHLDLFSGLGGFALAAQWAEIETVGFCEINKYCQKILRKNFPGTPIHSDIKNVKGDEFGKIDIITGGYPCQPFSLAGERKGKYDERHLWPELLRVIETARPAWVVCENVYGHITMGLDEVCDALEAKGYTVQSFVIPAISKGAPHKRDRVWIVAHLPDTKGGNAQKCAEKPIPRVENIQVEFRRMGEVVGVSTEQGKPAICGAFDGVSVELDEGRKERLTALGNAIVPQVAFEILSAIKAVSHVGNKHETDDMKTLINTLWF